jgi:putative zinc finger/helix-turn-helix YgiT family protein
MKHKIQCVKCDYQKDLVWKLQKVYKYEESGLNVTLKNGVHLAACPQCGEQYVSIRQLDSLHAEIEKWLLLKDGLLSGTEVRFLRTRLGFSTKKLATIMGHSYENISKIENGKLPVTKHFDRALRFMVKAKHPDRDYDLHDALYDGDLKKFSRLSLVQDSHGWAAAS